MPQKKSAIKRRRQDEKLNARNRAMRSKMATAVKKAQGAPAEEREAANLILAGAFDAFDQTRPSLLWRLRMLYGRSGPPARRRGETLFGSEAELAAPADHPQGVVHAGVGAFSTCGAAGIINPLVGLLQDRLGEGDAGPLAVCPGNVEGLEATLRISQAFQRQGGLPMGSAPFAPEQAAVGCFLGQDVLERILAQGQPCALADQLGTLEGEQAGVEIPLAIRSRGRRRSSTESP